MKKMIALALTVGFLSQTASAAIFQPIVKYIVKNKVVELDNIDRVNGTASYYDYATYKTVKIDLKDASRETKEMNGVNTSKMVLVQFQNDVRPCNVYHVFENGQASIGCQTGKMMDNIGVPRPAVGIYIADTQYVSPEVETLDGFSKGEKVTLVTATESIDCGKTVRIEAIFPNGDVLVQKIGLWNTIDTSDVLMKSGVEKVSISDLMKR